MMPLNPILIVEIFDV
jgi:hypothetical protein